MVNTGFIAQTEASQCYCNGYASFHKNEKIKHEIEKQNHKLLWLPPYSPDLNPIEKAWVKRLRRKLKMKSVDELFENHCADYYMV